MLTPEIKELVNNALACGNPLVLAVVTSEIKPVLSFRGSTQVFSDSQLGFWIRHTSGGTIKAIKSNPHVAMMYRSTTKPMLHSQGSARITTNEAERRRVFANSPEREQKSDPERKGIAVIIDLTKVDGVLRRAPNGAVAVKLIGDFAQLREPWENSPSSDRVGGRNPVRNISPHQRWT